MILEISATLWCEFDLRDAESQVHEGELLAQEFKALARERGWSLDLRNARVHGEHDLRGAE